MSFLETKIKSQKTKKNSELKHSKTEAMLFFLKCLNESVDISAHDEFVALQHLSSAEKQNLVQAFKDLPHPPLMFFQMINTYRGAKILKILGENINPSHLKIFTKENVIEKSSKQNRIECQLIFSMIESNQDAYKNVLQLFIKSFEKNVQLKWEENEPNLLEQHLEKQKRLFAQKNSTLQKSNDIGTNMPIANIDVENTGIKKIVATVEQNQVAKRTSSVNEISEKNSPAAIDETKNLIPSSDVSSVKNVSQSVEKVNEQSKVAATFQNSSQSVVENDETQKDLVAEDQRKSEKMSIYEIARRAAEENSILDDLFDIDKWK